MVAILIMQAKLDTLSLLKKGILKKGYDDLTNKVLWRDSKYIVDVVMWPKFGNSSISMIEVIWTSSTVGSSSTV